MNLSFVISKYQLFEVDCKERLKILSLSNDIVILIKSDTPGQQNWLVVSTNGAQD